MIIRDNEGDVLAVVCSNLNYTMKLVIVEALALRKAMDVCAELEMTRVILERDSDSCEGYKQ